MKPYRIGQIVPSSNTTMETEIPAMLRLREQVSAREIREIRIEGGVVHRMLAEPLEAKRRPQTAIDAKFSLPFTVATAFVTGRVESWPCTTMPSESPISRTSMPAWTNP